MRVPPSAPHAELELELFASGCSLIAGIDEVGRGAWAGPVSVGVAVVDVACIGAFPPGVRDSKLLSPIQRFQLFPDIERACVTSAVGHASPQECDSLGMTRAQGLATERALAQLSVEPEAVIVDGKHDFTGHRRAVLSVGADRTSIVVAAASVLAKVVRDRLLVEASHIFPGYHLERNKGYASLEHRQAVAAIGLSAIHRHSWSWRPPAEQGPELGKP